MGYKPEYCTQVGMLVQKKNATALETQQMLFWDFAYLYTTRFNKGVIK